MHIPKLWVWLLRAAIATVWMLNGLWCKVLHGVPRHEAIVARILGRQYAAPLTVGIGIGEVAMAGWVMSGRYARACAVTQICGVLLMNSIEATLAPDLLLFGPWNAVFAGMLAACIALAERLRRTSRA